jgi:putative oxidoreductase
MTQLVERYYRLLIRVSSNVQSPFLLAVRLYWGWQFMQTGWGKLTDIGKVVGFFADLGIPAPALNAYFVSALEFGGGLLLILGLGSRLIALPLVINMIVAYVTADREALRSFPVPTNSPARLPIPS